MKLQTVVKLHNTNESFTVNGILRIPMHIKRCVSQGIYPIYNVVQVYREADFNLLKVI